VVQIISEAVRPIYIKVIVFCLSHLLCGLLHLNCIKGGEEFKWSGNRPTLWPRFCAGQRVLMQNFHYVILRGIHPPRPMMLIAYSPISAIFINFSLLFSIFVLFRFGASPTLTMMHLHMILKRFWTSWLFYDKKRPYCSQQFKQYIFTSVHY